MTKRLPRVDATRIGSKKIGIPNRIEKPILDDLDTMNETITDTIQ